MTNSNTAYFLKSRINLYLIIQTNIFGVRIKLHLNIQTCPQVKYDWIFILMNYMKLAVKMLGQEDFRIEHWNHKLLLFLWLEESQF